MKNMATQVPTMETLTCNLKLGDLIKLGMILNLGNLVLFWSRALSYFIDVYLIDVLQKLAKREGVCSAHNFLSKA